MDRRGYLRALGVGGAASLAGCRAESAGSAKTGAPDDSLTLATATTAHDSGLLGELNPAFRESFGIRVETLVRGTGGALRTARDGDCDLVLVHARPLEDAFLRDGHGVNRRSVMRNDFLVVGPPDDPAGVADTADPRAAFRGIADDGAPFLSRGDRSGTHVRERRIWDGVGIEPSGEWYRETGQGMGDTLTTADQSGAYTLADRATFLTLRSAVEFAVYVDHGIMDPPALLDNRYGVIPVNPARHDVNYAAAMVYVGYLTGPGQAIIDGFRREAEPVFEPTALSAEPAFEQYVPQGFGE